MPGNCSRSTAFSVGCARGMGQCCLRVIMAFPPLTGPRLAGPLFFLGGPNPPPLRLNLFRRSRDKEKAPLRGRSPVSSCHAVVHPCAVVHPRGIHLVDCRHRHADGGVPGDFCRIKTARPMSVGRLGVPVLGKVAPPGPCLQMTGEPAMAWRIADKESSARVPVPPFKPAAFSRISRARAGPLVSQGA
jgi:hypothetical protein